MNYCFIFYDIYKTIEIFPKGGNIDFVKKKKKNVKSKANFAKLKLLF